MALPTATPIIDMMKIYPSHDCHAKSTKAVSTAIDKIQIKHS